MAPLEAIAAMRPSLSRRHFLAAGAAAVGVVAALPSSPAEATGRFVAASAHETQSTLRPTVTGRWLGPDVWGNRLADWTVVDGGWSCVPGPESRGLCTASVLTRRLTGGPAELRVGVRPDGTGVGFAGFLVGTGTDDEHRRTALVAGASGTGGGVLAIVDRHGAVAFRDHSDEEDQLAYRRLASAGTGPGARADTEAVTELVLAVVPIDDVHVRLTLTALDATGAEISSARRSGVAGSDVAGGVALVSGSDDDGGARWTLTDLSIAGAGVETSADRELGAVFGTLFSVAGDVLKMTAQVAPFDRQEGDQVVLETLSSSGEWQQRATAPVGIGYVGALRVDDWNAAQAATYRVRHTRVDGIWSGTIPAEPRGDRPVRVATISCAKAAHRPIDVPSRLDGGLSGGRALPLYAVDNVWFPYEATLSAVAAQRPDVLVAMGDQYYENSPTREDTSADPELDFIYKYLQWLWSVRDLTKDVPTLILVDDHDVFQGNFWGEGGIPAPGGDGMKGGFEKRAAWVNLVQRVQCGHNPDPIDPAPVAQGINVYFTRFDYAGITFVILEDRKFKTSPDGVEGNPDAPFELLGPRQEAMLDQLARDKQARPGPTIVLTQTLYASLQTTADGQPTTHRDSNGFPKPARDRALTSIKAAGAVMLSGDTHLASLVQHLDLPGGPGPIQFTGPAVASSYQRWFSPSGPLPGARGFADTGVTDDGLGNRLRVLAVANPLISQADIDQRCATHNVGQRSLKQEGYGLCVVDPVGRTYRFEAWPGGVDPTAPGAAQLPGWPWSVGFDAA